jgi:hypothetical protein
MAGRLSPEQRAFYQQEGYVLHHEPVLPPPKFARLKAHFERKLAHWAEDSGGKSPEHMDTPHFTDPVLFEWLFADKVLDLVESLIGPDIALWSSHFICKPAGIGKRVPWHEDSAYWGKVLEPMEVVTLWLAVDYSGPENGCMRVIPRTHGHGYSSYDAVADPEAQVFGSEIRKGSFDEASAVDFVLRPNECSLHHAKLIHGSNANTSSLRRCGYTMRYIPATTRFKPEFRRNVPGFQIYLARGRDRAGNDYGDPTKVNEAWVNANPDELRRIRQLTG